MESPKSSARRRRLFSLCQSGLLPELRLPEDRPLTAEDCAGHAERVLPVLRECADILRCGDGGGGDQDLFRDSSDVKELLVPLVALCGEHAESAPWSSPDCISASYAMLAHLREDVFSARSMREVLMTAAGARFGLSRGQLLDWLVEFQAPRVARERFRKFPGACRCCAWLLHQLVSPDVGDLVHFFLPFSLCLLGDWEDANKLRGLQCLSHLIQQVGRTDLTWYGRSDLLKSVLDPHVSSVSTMGDVRVMDAALSVYSDLLEKSGEKKSEEANPTCKMNDEERLVKKVLQGLEVEARLEVKEVLCRHLLRLAPRLGPRVARWLSRIARVADAVLAAPGGEETCKAHLLRVLLVALSAEGLPAPTAHAGALLRTLFRLLYEASKEEEEEEGAWQLLSEDCLECLTILKERCPSEFDGNVRGLAQLAVNSRFDKAFSEICV